MCVPQELASWPPLLMHADYGLWIDSTLLQYSGVSCILVEKVWYKREMEERPSVNVDVVKTSIRKK